MIERFAGRYALLQRLGGGGMGEVFLARDLSTGTECALKRLHQGAGREMAAILESEFRELTRARHPAVVSVFELGFAPDGRPFFTMEYVPGLPADRAIASGDRQALGFAAVQLAHGIEALHDLGIVHGDLKPSNVLVVPGPEPDSVPSAVRLVDFGLAHLEGEAAAGGRGAPGYAAPEVVRGAKPNAASDLYGLGATLFVLASGRKPFEAPSVSGILRLQQSGPPNSAALEEAGLPAAFIQLVLRLLSPTPGERGESAREVRRELERLFPAAHRPLAGRLQSGRTVGRERELAQFESWLADPKTLVRMLLVTGATGMGVSTLLDEIASRAALAGRGIIRLSGAMPAGAAARVLLRRLLADSEATDEVRAWLAAEDVPLRDADVGMLAEAAARRLRAAENDRELPLVLVDDRQPLDPVTRTLLRRALLAPRRAVLRSVWAQRGSRSSLGPDERTLHAAGYAEVIELAALPLIDAGRLAASRLGMPAPESLMEWLWARAAGHPGLTVELLRHAAEAGAIVEDDEGLRVSRPALDALAVPSSFEASLLMRWTTLPEDARGMAAALAVWDRPVTLAEVKGLEPRATLPGLDRLASEGLVSREGEDRFAFSPPALAARVLDLIEPAVRRELHERVLSAGALGPAERFTHLRATGQNALALAEAEAAFAERPDDRLATAAAALCEAAQPADAARWYERAGRTLFDRARHAASVPMFERALALDSGGESRHARRAALAQALYRAGDLEALEPLLAAALADHPPAAIRGQLSLTSASLEISRGQYEAATRELRTALEVAEGLGDDAESGVAALSLAYALRRLGRHEEAEAAARKAMACYSRAGQERGVLRARAVLATIARQTGRYEESERMFRETLDDARAARERFVVGELLAARHVVWTELGRWRLARIDVDEALQIALEDGRGGTAATMMISRAVIDGLTGRPRAARRHSRGAIRMTRVAYPSMRSAAYRALAQAHRISGRLGMAESLARRALSLSGAPLEERDWGRYELGRVLLATRRADEARTLLSREEEDQPLAGIGHAALVLLAGRAALRSSDPDATTAAERLLIRAEEWRADRPLAWIEALAAQLRAEIAFRRGHLEEAGKTATRSLEQFAALQAWPDQAAAALEFVQLCQEGSDERTPVATWLEDAAATFQRLGDLRSRERALAILVRRLQRTRPASERSAPAPDLIAAVSRLLNSLSDVRELATRAMRLVVDQLDAERGVLLLVDPESGELTPMAEHGAVDLSTRRNALGYSRRIVERVARGGAVLLEDVRSEPGSLSESILEMGIQSILCVPMYVGGRVIGAVYLDDARRMGAFGDEDRAMLEGFAQLMAIAFEKSRDQEEVERKNLQLVGENIQLRQQAAVRFQTQNLIAESSEMRAVLATLESVAHSDATVMLTGENGTGKELIALTLHHNSKRHDRPFVPVNCGAIPDGQIEAELFGILDRTATGVGARAGRFLEANGGTVFLDEVAEMLPQHQVALLRVLAAREVVPVGGGKPVPIDVRVIAATNRNLAERIKAGDFRPDLFYRLNVIPIEIPPLRDRKADIPALARHFAELFARQQQRETPTLSPELLAALMQSDWPGNVRELQNYIERLMAMNPGSTLHPSPLPRDLEHRSPDRLNRPGTLAEITEDIERRMIREALARSDWNQTAAARKLGLTEQSLRYKLRKYGISESRRYLRIRRK